MKAKIVATACLVGASLLSAPKAYCQTVTALVPNQAAVGSIVELRVIGSGFSPSNAIAWITGAQAVGEGPILYFFERLQTQFISSNELRAIVGPNLLDAPKVVPVAVHYSGGEECYYFESCLTNSLPFTVNVQLTQITPDRGIVNTPVNLVASGAGFNSSSVLVWRKDGVETLLPTAFVNPNELRTQVPGALLDSVGVAEVLVQTGFVCEGPCPRTNSRPFAILQNLVLSQVDPPRAPTSIGDPQDIRLIGTGFAENAQVFFQVGSQSVSLGIVTRLGSTEIVARIPAVLINTPVTAQIFVRNPGSGEVPNRDSNAQQFVVFVRLTLSGVDPVTVTAGSPATVFTALGTGFTAATRIRFTSVAGTFTPGTQTVDAAGGRIRFTVNADLLRQPTTYRAVAFDGGSVSNEVQFRVIPGAILTSMSPTSRPAGSGPFQLTITGTGFAQGAQVLFGEGTVLTPSSIDATQIVVTVTPPGTAGTLAVRVRVSGAESNSLTFTVTPGAPILSSLDPGQRLANSGSFELRLTGQNLAPSPSVTFGGESVPVVGGSASEIRVQIANALIQTPRTVLVQVRVGTQDSNILNFTITQPTPSISSLSPSSRVAGSGDFSLTIAGQNLSPNPAVQFGGQALGIVGTPSGTSIQVQVPGSLVQQPGPIAVLVQVGSLSAQATFTVTAPVIPPATVTSPTATVEPRGNTTTRVALSGPAPVALTGTLVLTFTPNAEAFAGSIDPAMVFVASGTRSLNFTIPAGQTEAQIPDDGRVNVGTVAGTISVGIASLTALGQPVASLPGAREIVVPRSGPVLAEGSVRLVNSTGGVTVEASGYAPSRQITQARVAFTILTGTDVVGSASFDVPLQTPFATWFASPGGRESGSRFLLRIPFTVEEGDANRITGVTITLINPEGQASLTGTR